MKRILGKALKILIVPLLFLMNYPIQKAIVGEWQDKFGSEMVYLPYWKHWMEDEAAAYHMTRAARHFEKTKGRWPKDLRELEQAKFIPKTPPSPSGGRYVLDAKRRRVRIEYFKETDVKVRREEIAFDLLSAADKFQQTYGRPPADIEELVEKRIIDQVPEDPGGCDFCYDPYRKQVGIEYGKFIRQIRFGWNNVVADLLWIRGFHYVQGQWQLIEAGHRKPKQGWHAQLPDLYEVITDLDPHFIPAYRGGATLVSVLSKNPRRAIRLLEKGVRLNPRKYWELPYQLACIVFLETGDDVRALKLLEEASDHERYPNTGPAVLRLRSFLETKHDRFDVAIRIWEPWLQKNSPVYKQMAENRIARIFLQIIKKRLLDEAEGFKKAKGRAMNDEEFAEHVKAAKEWLAQKYSEKCLRGAVDVVMKTGFRLWQFARFRPPAGEPPKTTIALGMKRQSALAKLQDAVERFRKKRGQWPDSLNDLVKEKLIDKVPSPQGGGEYYLEFYPRPSAPRPLAEEAERKSEPKDH
ncbi:MAG: hypothetical protein GXP25_19460 [Planctomycetes bacterium]|nr:hypothetical protein [Planctomycetota bacterium]